MIEGDELLYDCNDSELHWMARKQGLPILRFSIPHEEMVAIVCGAMPIQEHHLAHSNHSRWLLESFIQKNIDRVRGQLPGCNGMCQSFLCSEGKHMSCYIPSEPLLI
jgi:hypothetical protein